VQLSIYFLIFWDHPILFGVFENRMPLKLVLGDLDSIAHFITVNEQTKSNRDLCFHSSFAFYVSGEISSLEFITVVSTKSKLSKAAM